MHKTASATWADADKQPAKLEALTLTKSIAAGCSELISLAKTDLNVHSQFAIYYKDAHWGGLSYRENVH